jgi:hypothetical protein
MVAILCNLHETARREIVRLRFRDWNAVVMNERLPTQVSLPKRTVVVGTVLVLVAV